jgi:arginine exporter protein ArgO
MNKTLKGIMTFSHITGIILVIIGFSVFYTSHQNLARILIILGAFLYLLFHFMSYKEEMKKKDSINTEIAFSRFARILIMQGFVFFFLFFK